MVCLIAGCHRAPKPEDTIATALSWTESAHLTAERWRAHAVTRAFATDALTQAADALEQQRRQLVSAPAGPAADSLVLSADGAVDSARAIVQRDAPRSVIDPALVTLDDVAHRLRALHDSLVAKKQ
jgi:hypothetical protein